MPTADVVTWGIAGLATLCVVLRPFSWPEAIWAVAGALALVLGGLLTPAAALRGVMRGLDVYLFLIGMMGLAELARREGLFGWLAGFAVHHAEGSAPHLFTLVYLVGIVVTTFLSNDATAVVLTPAVYAAAKAARADPLPYLFICAFIANAASFVLPISNPANLVVYASHMPPLAEWLTRFGLASILSIATTYAVLRVTQRDALRQEIATQVVTAPLSPCGKLAGAGILLFALCLIAASARGLDLGLPTFAAGAVTVALVLIVKREAPWSIGRDISWGVLPLVAGLFVLVEALELTGVLRMLAAWLKNDAAASEASTAWTSGILVAIACNLVNNLPAGLLAGTAVQLAEVSPKIAGAVLIGVDLGPNLSVTGSLATILWLIAIRREGETVGAWQFIKLGALVMPPALILAIAGLLLTG